MARPRKQPNPARDALAGVIQAAAEKRKTPPNPRDILEAINDGKTARAELDIWRARRLMREELIASGELVWRDQVESATVMLWETVGNDLRYTLPGEIADRMPNAAAARSARKAARDAVEQMIESWKKAGACIENIGTAGKDQKPENVARKKVRASKPD
jgi:hypothetical protein